MLSELPMQSEIPTRRGVMPGEWSARGLWVCHLGAYWRL